MNNYSKTNADGSREVQLDNGDGTGTRTFYNPAGEVVAVLELNDLPIPAPEAPSPEDRIAELEALVERLMEGR